MTRGGGLATIAVRKAIEEGILPKLDGIISCVDCGKTATEYDHRDYNYPLIVEPTCHSCNCKRGAAIPTPGEPRKIPTKWSAIIEALLKKGFTETILANECGTTQATINRLKRGHVGDPIWGMGETLIGLYKRYKRRKDR